MKSYTLHVSLPGAGRVWRKLELRGDQTLEDLHYAIQDAYGWDADHLYSFFMSNKAWDPTAEYTLPEDALYEGVEEEYDAEDDEEEEGQTFSLADWRAMSQQEQADLMQEFTQQTGLPGEFFQDMLQQLEQMEQNPELFDDEEEPGDVRSTVLDALALKPKQEFMYLFDYGDEHRFQVRVETIKEFVDPDAVYPRLVESVGDAPEQYSAWDDEDWEEVE